MSESKALEYTQLLHKNDCNPDAVEVRKYYDDNADPVDRHRFNVLNKLIVNIQKSKLQPAGYVGKTYVEYLSKDSVKKDSLGDRMKRYELVTSNHLTRRMPVIVRVDGRAFHTFTRPYEPFDLRLRDAMIYAAQKTANEMQGFQVAYHQSDEVSFLLTDYGELGTDAWFDYNISKVTSISSALMTANFLEYVIGHGLPYTRKSPPIFDARAFNVPKEDVSNAFLWRCKDWARNSLSMFCMQFFSHKVLHGLNTAERHEKLHTIGKNWATDVSSVFRNGTFIFKDELRSDFTPSYEAVSAIVDPFVFTKETV